MEDNLWRYADVLHYILFNVALTRLGYLAERTPFKYLAVSKLGLYTLVFTLVSQVRLSPDWCISRLRRYPRAYLLPRAISAAEDLVVPVIDLW